MHSSPEIFLKQNNFMNLNTFLLCSTITYRSVSALVLTVFLFSSLAVQSQDAPVLEWARNFKVEGGNEDSHGYGVATDAAGNVYTTGSFNGVVDLDPGAGVFNVSSASYYEQDIYISKLDVDGNFAWGVRLGSGQSDFGYSIVADAGGNVYVTGLVRGGMDFDPGPGTYFLSAALSADNIFVLKLDTNGNFLWGTILGSTAGTGVGRGITLDGSGNVLTTGNFTGTADFDPSAATFNITSLGSEDIFLSKLDANGNFVWAKSMGGTQGDRAYTLAVDNSGNLITTGFYRGTADFDPSAAVFELTTPSVNGEIFISKYDNNGNFIWAKSTSGSTGTPWSRSIDTDGTGNIIFTGFFAGTLDFDPSAATFNLTSTGDYDVFISKLDANGNFVWAHSLGGSSGQPDQGMGLAVDASGNIVTTGFFNGTADFDFGPGTFSMTSGPAVVGPFYRDIYILKLDNDGNFIWARSTGNTNQGDEGHGIATDASGNVTVTGSFSTSADFDFGPCTATLNATFNADINAFVEKITLGPTYIPTLTSVSPTSGPIGTVITITGNDFSPVLADNILRFLTTPLPVSAVTSTTITATIPTIGNGAYNVRLQIGCVSITNGPIFTVTSGALPTITSFTPTTGVIGTTVTITGTNFSTTPANNTVKFNGTTATATASTTTNITTTVPAGASTGKITVTVGGNTATSATNFTVTAPLPTITSFTPASGPIGTTVTITGTNFSSTPANNTVKFNGTTAVASASTTTSITTTVPVGATTGTITVTVGGNTATSATNFTVTAAPTITFTTQPEDQVICAGTNTTLSVVASGDTNLQYRWQIDNAGFVDLANNSIYSGVNTGTLTITNPTVALNGKVYRCVVRGDNSANTPSASADLTVLGVPNAPTIGDQSLGCAPASTTLIPTGALAGESYRYYDAAAAGNLLSSGISFPTPSLSLSTTYYISVFHTTTLCESTRTPALVSVQTCNAPVVMATTSAAYLEGIVTVDLSPLISDPDNNLDIGTLRIASQPESGATATLDELILTVDYSSLPFPGTDIVTIEVCDLTEICIQQQLTIEVSGDIEVFNAVSPNADGKNDAFLLKYIDLFTDTQDNKVTIFNRWGDVISEIKNYNNKERVFKGLNKNGGDVPSGTYYYKIEFNSSRAAKMGYLVLNR
jgi:gliding motility-associated-like protein